MEMKPRHRVATDARLAPGGEVTLENNAAHYLTHVLRMREGDVLALFNRTDGEWLARLTGIHKKAVALKLEKQLRTPVQTLNFTVCFAPIKGGRLETIIEKATELGASVLQPVITQRTIVDKVNLERAEAIAREAAEQCERIDWPEIREPMKFEKFLGQWPKDIPLVYGDESGTGVPVQDLLEGASIGSASEPSAREVARSIAQQVRSAKQKQWGILAGPEGGFTPEEFAGLRHLKAALAVGLGPRILRADTAIITLSTATLMAWGDWSQPPRFTGGE